MPTCPSSVESLVNRVSANKTLAARYARHFGISPAAVVGYFKTLKSIALAKQTTVTAYYLTPSGRVQGKRRILPAGARVFASPEGQPILEQGCGNPLVLSLPRRAVVTTRPKPVVPIPPETVVTEPVVEEPMVRVAAVPPMETGVAPIVTEIAPIEVPVVPVIQPAVTVEAAPPVMAQPSFPGVGLVAPLLLGLVSVHKSSSSGNVPEPASLVTLAVCGSAAAVGMRRRIRR